MLRNTQIVFENNNVRFLSFISSSYSRVSELKEMQHRKWKPDAFA